MNDLNSILIEGKLNNDSIMKDNRCIFEITSIRAKDDITTVNVILPIKLSELYYCKLFKGREVRIVGRIKNENGIIIVEAEHLEIKHEIKRKKKND